VSTGIEARHARACASRKANGGRRCNCTPSYQAQVYDRRTKKVVKRTFATRTEAKRWRSDAQAALRRGELSADRGPMLKDALAAWIASLEAGHERNRSGDPYKPSAIRGYRHTLERRVIPVLGDRRVREVKPEHVHRWIEGLVRADLAPATIDSALTPLRAFYKRACARGDATVNPTQSVLKPAVRSAPKRVVSVKESKAMIAALSPSDRPLWAVAFYAGLRRSELIGLRWEDVDLAGGAIRVRRGWDMVEGAVAPKSLKGRRKIPMAAVLRDHLDEHRVQSGGEGRVFASQAWVEKANDRARKVWKEAELPTLTMHTARHTFASMMIAAGVNAKALSTYMGHANIAVTFDLYGHLMPGAESEAAELFDTYLAREAGGSTVAPPVAHPTKAAV
jgi:integrase